MDDSVQSTWEQYPAALPKETILAGRYIIQDVLGQGGFGITYLAEDFRTKAKAAVKEYFPETMAMRGSASLEIRTYTDERSENFRFGMERFLEEAKVLAQFQGNPHIVGVQQYFEENGTAYFVMDYIEGMDFKTYIKQNGGKLPWDDVYRIMLPIMEALDIVHKKGLIHRDVTPDNIIIADDGTVKLLDFGAARYSLGDRSRSLDVVLKPGYAPKEQYVRRGKQGAFTDVYSVAACFYAALSGYLPPESLERMEEDNLVPLSARGVQLSVKAEDAILKALEVRAEDRFQSMAEFREAIEGETPVQDRTLTSVQKLTMEKAAVEMTHVSVAAGQKMAQGSANENKTPDYDAARSAKKKWIFVAIGAACAAVLYVAVGILVGREKLGSGKFWIDNQEFSFPSAVSDWTDHGWHISNSYVDKDSKLEPRVHTTMFKLYKDDVPDYVWMRAYNVTDEDIKIEEGIITYLYMTFSSQKDELLVELPGGVTYRSTMEDVIEAYGEPVMKNDDELGYMYDTGKGTGHVLFQFDRDKIVAVKYTLYGW